MFIGCQVSVTARNVHIRVKETIIECATNSRFANVLIVGRVNVNCINPTPNLSPLQSQFLSCFHACPCCSVVTQKYDIEILVFLRSFFHTYIFTDLFAFNHVELSLQLIFIKPMKYEANLKFQTKHDMFLIIVTSSYKHFVCAMLLIL